MTEICPKDECTGCGVCAAVCPKDCIKIVGDDFGYLHPEIDNNICINCMRCAKTCPNNNVIDFHTPSHTFASWALDNEERESSTSGGIASVLARAIIAEGGVVYGAVGYGAGNVEHRRAENIEDIDIFKKSKYVQSTITKEIYQDISKDLSSQREVLFIGTPCQTAAVRAMNKKSERLICVDLICHGIPSQKLLKEHIQMVVGKDASGVTSFTTRDEEGHYLTLWVGDRLIYRKPFPEDQYLNAFQYGLFYRPSCYQCHYARPERQSDITIGDFWGLGETDYPHRKVSVILANTRKGRDCLTKIGNIVFMDPRPLIEAVDGNSQLRHPSPKHKYYTLFREIYLKKGYKTAITQSLREFYIKNKIYRIVSSIPGFTKWYKK